MDMNSAISRATKTKHYIIMSYKFKLQVRPMILGEGGLWGIRKWYEIRLNLVHFDWINTYLIILSLITVENDWPFQVCRAVRGEERQRRR